MKSHITIIEVGPRDGLQNEKTAVALADKIKFIELLAEAGLAEIEAGSFVSPKWVPQMADSEKIFEHLRSVLNHGRGNPAPTYIALVPNETGMAMALKCGVKKIAVFTAASETFNQKNINCSIDESFKRFEPVIASAKKNKIAVRGYVSTAFVCPYDGDVLPAKASEVIQRLNDCGVDEISIGDTIGKASVTQVRALLDLVCKNTDVTKIAMHFHDTFNLALKNVEASLNYGITRYDASAAGLGGCPYAPGAKGNLNSALLVEFLHNAGYHTGIDLTKLKLAGDYITRVINP